MLSNSVRQSLVRPLVSRIPSVVPPSTTLSSSIRLQTSQQHAPLLLRHFTLCRSWDKDAVMDLFASHAQNRNGVLCMNETDIRTLLQTLGEAPDERSIHYLFELADADHNGVIDFDEFLEHADVFLNNNPARLILVVGGPGSGKGILCQKLVEHCNVVHLSSGELLRDEVAQQTTLGQKVEQCLQKGELVSSAMMVALMKKKLTNYPGKRVILDGFPRSLENCNDLVTFCGKPELAINLTCDTDTILMERILHRRRADDTIEVALNRLRTYHKYRHITMDWLKSQHIPIVNLDCSGPPDSVWHQLLAIGRLMRSAVKQPTSGKAASVDVETLKAAFS